MSRTTWMVWLCGGCLLAVVGCANRMELNAINGFAAALDKKDLEQLKANSSEDFEQKALRLDECIDDLKILRLPTDKSEIVSVQDVSPTEKYVTAKVGDSKRKLKYHLVKDGKSRKWVVDDIYIKQKREGIEVTKSVTEQMDLLLSVREFLHAWDTGDRDATLAATNPKFRAALVALPPAYLAQLTRQVIGSQKGQSRIRPEAQLDENVAVVKIPRMSGHMLITYELKDSTWLVTDLAVDTRTENESIPSVMKHAIALTTAVEFLQAYNAEDRETLARVCTQRFYAGGLAPADLTAVPLPSADVPVPNQQFRLLPKRAEMEIPTDSELVKLSLIREESEDADSPVRFHVEDVTLYDLNGSQEKRLSSMFTAHAVLALFSDALSSRDLPMLRKTSTADFNRRVWDRLKQSGPVGTVALGSTNSHTTIDDLPLGELELDSPQVVKTVFNGAVTEITVRQGKDELTYLLRERTGEVRVDDILLPESGRPRSLKETTELIVPLREFVAGLQLRELGLIQRTSSNDYNRLVWKQTDRVPELTNIALRHLRTSISEIDSKPDQVMITLGDERWGAKVNLVREYSQLVVDDVLLVGGVETSQRLRLKTAMRQELAGNLSNPTGLDERVVMRPGYVQHANGEEYADEEMETEPEPEDDPDLTPPAPSDDAFRAPPPLQE